MKKFLLVFITVIITAAVTASICLFVIPKKDGGDNEANISNEKNTNTEVNSTNENVSNKVDTNNTKDSNQANTKDEKYEEITAKYKNEDDWIKNGKETKVAFKNAFYETNGDYYRGLSITGIDKNNDGTYTIKGVLYKDYKLTDEEYSKLEKNGYITIYGEKYNKDTDRDPEESVDGIFLEKDGENITYCVNEESKKLTSNTQWGECYRISDKHMKITLPGSTLVLGSSEVDMEEGNGTTVEKLYNTKMGNTGYDDESGNKYPRLYNFVFKDNKCIELFSIPYES